MNKKISNVILGAILSVMTITTICIGISNKEEYKVVDIYGNREELDNVVIAYQDRKGLYKTTEVNISKDNIKIYDYAKEMIYGTELTKFNKDNRFILNTLYGGSDRIYKDDNVIINAKVNRDYNYYNVDADKVKFTVDIKEKNLDTNKVEKAKIDLESSFDYDLNMWYNTKPIKYNGELYIGMFVNTQSSSTGEEKDYLTDGCFIEIYKLNLEDNTSKVVFSEKVSELSKTSEIIDIFVNNNSFYFIKDTKKANEGKDKNTTIELLEYNLENKKINSTEIYTKNWSEEFKDILDDKSNYSVGIGSPQTIVEDNKVTLISYIDNNNEMYIYKTILDLENNNILSNNEKYTIKTNDIGFDHNISKFKLINNKIYIQVLAYQESDVKKNIPYVNKNYIYVIDKNSKETLYIGQVSQESENYTDINILKKEEM